MRGLLVAVLVALACAPATVTQDRWRAIAEVHLDAAQSQIRLARELVSRGDVAGATAAYRTALELVSAEEIPEGILARAQALADTILDEYHALLSALPSLPDETPAWAVIAELEVSGPAATTYSLEGDDNVYDMPVVMNEKVARVISYFTTKGRKPFTVWLERMGMYEGLLRGILAEHGLPRDLVYLAMIESGFNPKARSYARAVGMWQFIAGTAKRYGLRIDHWVDERCDVIKSTHAACRYLKDLYQQFGSWELALAGYNCGEGKVESSLRRHNTNDYWKLHRLPKQTRDYVPTFMAAMIMAKSPQRYGFSVEPLPPLEWDSVEVPDATSLDVVARCAGVSQGEVEFLNPELRRRVTPPGERYTLRVPKGTGVRFAEEYAKVPRAERLTWIHHRVSRGETLSLLARRYGTTVESIREVNRLGKSSLIREGSELIIPVAPGLVPPSADTPVGDERRYTVRKGDTLGRIAARHGVSLRQLCEWNQLEPSSVIHPGDVLTLWPSSPADPPPASPARQADPPTTYVVKPGDSLSRIAQRHGVTVASLQEANGLRGTVIRPNQVLKIPAPGGANPQVSLAQAGAPGVPRPGGAPRDSVYVVKRGDTLWSIACRFGVGLDELRRRNVLSTDTIRPGQRLVVPRPPAKP